MGFTLYYFQHLRVTIISTLRQKWNFWKLNINILGLWIWAVNIVSGQNYSFHIIMWCLNSYFTIEFKINTLIAVSYSHLWKSTLKSITWIPWFFVIIHTQLVFHTPIMYSYKLTSKDLRRVKSENKIFDPDHIMVGPN